MTTGGGTVGGEIFVNIRTEGGTGVPGAGGAPRPAGGGGGAPPKDPGLSLLNEKQKEQLEKMREEKKALKEYQDFQKLKNKENQNELLNELQRARKQATMVAGAVTTGMLARNSKIMSTSMGALQQIFGAFIDVFLMPFIPLIIPVLTSLAKLLPRFKEWWEKLVSAEGWAGALKKAAGMLKDMIIDWGVKVGELMGFSRTEVEKFYTNVEKWAKKVWGGFTSAIGFITSAWCEGGGTVWGFIKAAASKAWDAIVGYAKGVWDNWADKHPAMAAKITSAWCAASNFVSGVWARASTFVSKAWSGAVGYIQRTWEASGCNFGNFMLIVGANAGSAFIAGMKWLWESGGGGLKDHIEGLFVGLGDFFQSKGFGRLGLPASTVESTPGEDYLNLRNTDVSPGYQMTLAADMAQILGKGKGNPINMVGAMGSSDTAARVVSGIWSMMTKSEGISDMTSSYSRGVEREKYDTNVEEKLSDALTKLYQKKGIEAGHTAEQYERQLEISLLNATQFGIMPDKVEVTRRGGKMVVKVQIDQTWDGSTYLDGVSLYSGG